MVSRLLTCQTAYSRKDAVFRPWRSTSHHWNALADFASSSTSQGSNIDQVTQLWRVISWSSLECIVARTTSSRPEPPRYFLCPPLRPHIKTRLVQKGLLGCPVVLGLTLTIGSSARLSRSAAQLVALAGSFWFEPFEPLGIFLAIGFLEVSPSVLRVRICSVATTSPQPAERTCETHYTLCPSHRTWLYHVADHSAYQYVVYILPSRVYLLVTLSWHHVSIIKVGS